MKWGWMASSWLFSCLQQNKKLATLSPEFFEMLVVREILQFGNMAWRACKVLFSDLKFPQFWVFKAERWKPWLKPFWDLSEALSLLPETEVWEKGCVHWELLLLLLLLNSVTTSRKNISIYHSSTPTSLFTFLSGSFWSPGNYFAEKNIHYS